MANKKVWFITGASQGLGLSLTKKLLAQGYRVAATSRNTDKLIAAVGTNEGDFLPLHADLASEQSIAAAIGKTQQHFGRIDVVVNNAGYGIGGTIEELDQHEIHQSFDVNVFATIQVIKAAMPYMRRQRSGHIINISSIAGFAPAIGWGIYAATKYAVIGLSEVLAEEVKPFGINVTVIAPGAFRTNFLTQESLVLAKDPIEDYKAVRASHAKYLTMDGTQAGNPEKAADVFISLTENPEPPVLLFLGTDAYNRASQKISILNDSLEALKETSFSTDF